MRLVLWKRHILHLETACLNGSAKKGRFLVAKIEKELKNYSKTEKERVVKIFTKPKFLKIVKNEPLNDVFFFFFFFF